MLVDSGLNAKLNNWKSGNGLTHCFYDCIVFNKIKAMLGGRVRFMATGSAPIAGDVLDFLKVCFSCNILEAYGMTESGGGSTCTYMGDPNTGMVGGPMANTKIRLKDVPEMQYFHTNPEPAGEVCFYGPSIMTGYFKNPGKTEEAFTKDGWLMSGDVAKVLPNGAIKIVDRAKNIFKTSFGEYIAPEKLENVYVQS